VITLTVKVTTRKQAAHVQRLLEREGLDVERHDPERFDCYWCGGKHGLVCPLPADEEPQP
jgi:hypothetical protein